MASTACEASRTICASTSAWPLSRCTSKSTGEPKRTPRFTAARSASTERKGLSRAVISKCASAYTHSDETSTAGLPK